MQYTKIPSPGIYPSEEGFEHWLGSEYSNISHLTYENIGPSAIHHLRTLRVPCSEVGKGLRCRLNATRHTSPGFQSLVKTLKGVKRPRVSLRLRES